MTKQQVWWTGHYWAYENGDPLPDGMLVKSEPRPFPYQHESSSYWVEIPDEPKPAPKVKSRTLYTFTVNGIEIEAEEKVWRALRAQLVDLFGVYDPYTPSEER